MKNVIFPTPQWCDLYDPSRPVELPSAIVARPGVTESMLHLVNALIDARSTTGQITLALFDDVQSLTWLEAHGIRLRPEVHRPGGYLLDARPEGILVAGFDPAGLFYGLQSLAQWAAQPRPCAITIQDWPYKPLRGIHLYMPGRKDIPFFKRLVDWLAALKFNTIFLEVSGGMRYHSHPEINTAWEKFCREAEAYPGGPMALQVGGTRHLKNSTHTELGGGSCLEQDEVKDLLEYAHSRFFEIVPEVQSLSHSYYLCCAHPEIAELADDPWPDTYCPSNPRSYEIYFDLLEEVIAVFQPKLLSIGHDEIYTLGICPRCQGKSGNELLAGDLLKTHAFLKTHGVRMTLWADTLLPFSLNGWEGGIARHIENEKGASANVPETYHAIEQLPRDILICEWQGNTIPLAMQFFQKEGFEIYCGNFGDNFVAHSYPQWNVRSESQQVLGGEASTWCHVSEFAFSYNGCLFDMAFSAELLWWSHYRDSERGRLTSQLVGVMHQARQTLGERTPFDAQSRKKSPHNIPIELPAAASPLPFAPHLPGICLNTTSASVAITVGKKANGLVFTHTCQGSQKRRPTWELADPYHQPPENKLAIYQVEYQDGSLESIPVYFGTQVAHWDVPYGEHIDAIPYEADPVEAGFALNSQCVTLYRWEWINPHPAVAIARLTLTFRGKEQETLWITQLEIVT